MRVELIREGAYQKFQPPDRALTALERGLIREGGPF